MCSSSERSSETSRIITEFSCGGSFVLFLFAAKCCLNIELNGMNSEFLSFGVVCGFTQLWVISINELKQNNWDGNC